MVLLDDKQRGFATMSAHAAPDAADLLREVPAFSGLATSVRAELAARCELRTFRAGAALLPAGEAMGRRRRRALGRGAAARRARRRRRNRPARRRCRLRGRVAALGNAVCLPGIRDERLHRPAAVEGGIRRLAFDASGAAKRTPPGGRELTSGGRSSKVRCWRRCSNGQQSTRLPTRRVTSPSHRASIWSPRDTRRPASTSSAPGGCASPAAASWSASSSPAMSWKKPASCPPSAGRPASSPRPSAESTRLRPNVFRRVVTSQTTGPGWMR